MLRFFPSLLESKPLGLLEYITVLASQSYTALRFSLKMKILVSASLVPATWHSRKPFCSALFSVMGPLLSKGGRWGVGRLEAQMECAAFAKKIITFVNFPHVGGNFYLAL